MDILDRERQEQIKSLLEDLEINKLTIDTPPFKTEDGSVVETTKKSTQISPCVFGELVQELQDAMANDYQIDIKISCKIPK